MIYTASFFNVKNHHGAVYSIARSQPKDPKYRFPSLNSSLMPSKELLNNYKSAIISWEEYEEIYKNGLKNIEKEFFTKLFADELLYCGEITLVCWEPTPEKCHRRLLAEYLEDLGFPVEIN